MVIGDSLIKLDNLLTSRYHTLEKNIKSKSNSFYDSYLILLESTIKLILNRESIDYDESRTCGYILRQEKIEDFFKLVIKLEEYTYSKLIDYTKKVNDHKHKKEKNVTIDAIINYMKIFNNLIQCYFSYLEKEIMLEFNANYYVDIFGITIKENKEYKYTVEKLKSELQDMVNDKKLSEEDINVYKSLLSIKRINLLNLEEQNQELQRQISKLKDIKLNSLEEKLNRTIDLLLELKPAIVENRIITRAIGRRIVGLIVGNEDLEDWIEKEKKEYINE